MLAEPVDPPPPSYAPSPSRIAEVSRAVERQKSHKRTVVVGLKTLRREAREVGPQEAAEFEEVRPRTRADCISAPRPCPWVGCKYHTYLDVSHAGSIQFNQPGKALEDCESTCALDVADRGGVTLEEVGAVMSVTRERVRQLETRALERLIEQCEALEGRLATGQPLGASAVESGAHCVVCGQRFRFDGIRRCGECRRP